ncbi:MAG: bifunctional oligoribonuclease/PAP phosphatase NrnA [Clostridiales bacterium]|nr:bifunctional oligoribonuclease/PAP phosphatase NrnA [Clostridiales bacterium]
MDERVNAVAELMYEFRGSEKEVFVFPHVRVDGDCVGSAAALVSVLPKLDINASIVMDESIPRRLLFMAVPEELVLLYDADMLEIRAADMGLAIAVDCSEASRMGDSGELFSKATKTAIIDHHVSSKGDFGVRFIVPTSASTAELILEVIRILEKLSGVSLMDPFVANSLMVGIQSDTGRFSFQNTTPETLRAAAELLENGANVFINSYHLFDSTSVERMQLLAKAMAGAKMFYDGKLALAVITMDMLKDTNASEYAADGLVSSLRDIEGVVVSFVVRESEDNEVRVNVRSREPFDSAAFAELFDGGGHHRAAGFSIRGQTANEVCKMIIEKASAYFPENDE